ncbi:MAG: GNAT family N-acetyltransferase [Gemmatimonadales bacterium]|nr:MAG: GNAT family N-acetyltransferase [Gemmatimonadales bacterium]
MKTRRFLPEDRAACLAVFDSNVPGFFRSAERQAFQAFLEDPPGPFLVLEDRAEGIVGCGGIAEEGGGLASLCWGMVKSSRHGQGLGRRMLEARLDLMRRDPGIGTVRLETLPQTVGFFEKSGFQVASRERDGYAPGVDRVVLVRGL